MIDPARLQIFVSACDFGSFTEAANRCNLSQPTVSYHIKQLELVLNAELFDRSDSHQLKLTEAGQLLLPRARKLLHDINAIQQLISALAEDTAGAVRIACSATTARYILPLLAARFCQRYPEVNISITACATDQVIPCILGMTANLGVASCEMGNGDFDCQVFFVDHIVMIVPAAHEWVGTPYIEPADLVNVPFILQESRSGTRRALLSELAKYDIRLSDLNILLEIGNVEGIIRAVEAGCGVAFVSPLAAKRALELGAVVEVRVAGIDLHRNIYMMRHNSQMSNRAAEVFWGFIHAPSNADLLQQAET